MHTRIALVAGILFASSSFLAAQDQPSGGAAQEPPPAQAPAAPPSPPARDPRPYAQVITRDAVSDDGVFKVHRVRDRLYYEIPQSML